MNRLCKGTALIVLQLSLAALNIRGAIKAARQAEQAGQDVT